MSPALASPRRAPIRLAHVLPEIPGARVAVPFDEALTVGGVQQDSRRIEAGDLFVARRGARADGEAFVADAVRRGAVAVLLEAGSRAVVPSPAVRIETDEPLRALSFAAAAVYGHPTFSLEVVGVTGTNGKTTTTRLVRAALDETGARTGVVGTLGGSFEGLELESPHTSPEGDELARMAAHMRERGATHLAMEVSSIGLAQHRVDAVRFRVAAFTNLTQDHLDFHGDMTAYGEAKARLFLELHPGASAIVVDDAFGAELARRARAAERTSHVLTISKRVGADACVAPLSLTTGAHGVRMRVRLRDLPSGPGEVQVDLESPLVGLHNVENLLVALACAALADRDPALAARGLSRNVVVPGRMERCDEPGVDDLVVLVDYAHTPDALARVLDSARAFASGRLICVFGCGGDRDAGKRPLMGRAAAERADHVVITSDNPRSEDPAAIAEAIVPGARGGRASVELELDRGLAIERAVRSAAPGDVLVIAGKGHETYQIVGGQTFSFDDRARARAALAARRAAGGEPPERPLEEPPSSALGRGRRTT
jgi:UDP-N-acetylmuramoyl-L-alanyl-D-glutamate--2,6-diaminopimelate ligase